VRRRHVAWALRLVLSAALLALLFRLVDGAALATMLASLRPGVLLAGFALFVASIAIGTVRWQMLLRAAGERIGFWRLLGINLVGGFFSMFLPTAVGGDVARMYEVAGDAGARTRSVSTVLFDRAVGLASLVAVGLAAAVVGRRDVGGQAVLVVAAVAAGLAIAGWLFFDDRLVRRVAGPVFRLPVVRRGAPTARELYRSVHDLGRERPLLARTFAVSVAVQMTEIGSAVLIARALGIGVPAAYFFVFMPVVWVVTMVPVSLNGLGVREGAFVFFLQRVGTTSAEAVALSLLVYACRVVTAVAGGVVFAARSRRE
jgi:glycosyltransferase 2 family protein